MKTADLEGAMLARAVALALGWTLDADADGGQGMWRDASGPHIDCRAWQPHRDWMQGGPLIEAKKIELLCNQSPRVWSAFMTFYPTPVPHYILQESHLEPLVAAMRVLVRSVYGETMPGDFI